MPRENATRRRFLRGLAVSTAGALLAACAPQVVRETVIVEAPPKVITKWVAATPPPVRFVAATVSMGVVADVQANLRKFLTYMEAAAEKGAHLIAFPEIALQQCPAWGADTHTPTKEELDYVRDTAETIPGASTDTLVKKAGELGIYVVFGMTEASVDDGALYNTSVFLGPDGIVGKYRKMTLWDAILQGNEHLIWQRGNELGIVDSPLGTVGLMICADMIAVPGPELAAQGADLLVTISAWPSYSRGYYDDATKANAMRAERWHVVSNQVGAVTRDLKDCGHARVIDPTGEIVVDTGDEEGMVMAETDLLIGPAAVKAR